MRVQKRSGPKTRILTPIAVVVALSCLPPTSWAYSLNASNHTITVSPTGDYNQDARNALAYLVDRPDSETLWTLQFRPGKYMLSLPLYSVGLKNVNILSDPANPAKLIKGPDFNQAEYIFYTRMSSNVKLQGFEFYGKTSFQDNLNPVWPDQGVYFGSCRNVVVDQNKFFNFGNAALRITTSEVDPTPGVNSFNSVVTHNFFNNIYQVSTTSNDKIHGGTHGYRMEKNTFVNLRGSVKFASRTPGAGDVHLLNNVFNGGDHFGLEIDNYNDMEIRGNQFANIKSVAINIYTAGDQGKIAQGFPWGNNFTIADNTIQNSGRGIRFCPSPFFDGTVVTPTHLVIDNNNLSAIEDSNRNVAAIAIMKGKVKDVQITRNHMRDIQSKNYISLTPGSTQITDSGNTAEGASLASIGNDQAQSGPQIAKSPQKPEAPSQVSGQFDASNQSVRLQWVNHAGSDSREEVWGSLNGQKYSLIAKLNPQSTHFVHQFKRIPAVPAIYYVVKALNEQGDSPYSTPCKIILSP